MRSVEEIQAEIAELAPNEVSRLAKWLAEYEVRLWDRRIEEDASAGNLDRFIEEALAQCEQGKTRPLP